MEGGEGGGDSLVSMLVNKARKGREKEGERLHTEGKVSIQLPNLQETQEWI